MAPAGLLVGGALGATGAGMTALGATTAIGGAVAGAGLGSTIGGAVSSLTGGGLLGETPEARTQQIDNLTDDQKLLLSLSTRSAIKQFEKGRPKFKKKTVIGPTAIEKKVFKDVKNKILPRISDYPAEVRAQFEEQVADPARKQFYEETAPRLAARFNSIGSLSSSAFARQATQQGRELEEGLARQAGQLDFQAQQAQLPQYISALGVGGAQRGIQQAQRTGELNQFIANKVAPHPGTQGNPLGVQAFQNLAFQPQANPINPLLATLSKETFSNGLSGLFSGFSNQGSSVPPPPPSFQQNFNGMLA